MALMTPHQTRSPRPSLTWAILFIVRLWVRVDLHFPRLNKLGEFLHSILLLVNRQPELHINGISTRTARNDKIPIDTGEKKWISLLLRTSGLWRSLTLEFHCYAVRTVPAGVLIASFRSASVMFQLLPRRVYPSRTSPPSMSQAAHGWPGREFLWNLRPARAVAAKRRKSSARIFWRDDMIVVFTGRWDGQMGGRWGFG
jgi:hypothetical protein